MDEDKKLYQQVSRALRLIALAMVRDMKQSAQVDLLDRAGYGQAEIAQLLDSTPKAISVRLAELRRLRRDKRSKRTSIKPAVGDSA